MLTLSDILEQHLEEAASLSLRRMRGARSSLHSLSSLAQLDRRIDAHLDGLLVDAKNACALCESTLKFDDVGEVFVGAQVALASGEPERVERVLDIFCGAPEVLPGLIAALGWSPYARIAPVVQPMLASATAEQRYTAVAAHAVHRVSGEWLQKALYDDSPLVRARACRAVGELGRVDLISQLRPQFQSEDQPVAFWSCWSAGLLGDLSAVAALKRFVAVPEYAERVLDIVLRRLAPNAAAGWLEELAQDENNVRLVIQGSAIVGDPGFVPGVIGMMSIKPLARVAAEAFCAITGANLADEKLEALPPAPANEEEESALDPDEFLPWPDPQRVFAWWESNETRFEPGARYLLGKPVTPEQLQWTLRYGNQKLRHGAALELAMRDPGRPLFNVCAPTLVQQRLLGS